MSLRVRVSSSLGRDQGIDRAFLSEMRGGLVAKRAELQRRHHEINVEKVPESQEQAAILTRNEVSARQINHDRRQLRAIEDALHRMGTGEYGWCGRCNHPIPERRLRIVPEAIYCAKCQEDIEKQEAADAADVVDLGASW